MCILGDKAENLREEKKSARSKGIEGEKNEGGAAYNFVWLDCGDPMSAGE